VCREDDDDDDDDDSDDDNENEGSVRFAHSMGSICDASDEMSRRIESTSDDDEDFCAKQTYQK
jgi:hypothetical protein